MPLFARIETGSESGLRFPLKVLKIALAETQTVVNLTFNAITSISSVMGRVTVEVKGGRVSADGREFNIIDLPEPIL